MIQQTYRTPIRIIECAVCHRATSEGHAEKLFDDVWVCSWCNQE